MSLKKKAELARYLAKDLAEVDRLMAEDGLPFVLLPGPTKPTARFRLADVHAWLCKRWRGSPPPSLEEFVREFEGVKLKN